MTLSQYLAKICHCLLMMTLSINFFQVVNWWRLCTNLIIFLYWHLALSMSLITHRLFCSYQPTVDHFFLYQRNESTKRVQLKLPNLLSYTSPNKSCSYMIHKQFNHVFNWLIGFASVPWISRYIYFFLVRQSSDIH